MGCNLYHPSLIWAPSFLKLSGSDSMPLHMSTYFFGAEAEGLQVPWRWENHDLEMNIAYVMKPPISHCHIALFLLCSIQYYTTPTFCLLIHIFVGQTFESTSFRQCPATMAWPCFSLHAGLPLAKKNQKKTIKSVFKVRATPTGKFFWMDHENHLKSPAVGQATHEELRQLLPPDLLMLGPLCKV